MGLRELAHSDLIDIVNDDEYGGDDIVITSPSGVAHDFKAFSNDIFESIDPGTGQVVAGRVCTVSVLISELITHGFEGIQGVVDSSSRPWMVDTTDVNGRAHKFKVRESHPDNGMGLIPLILEAYVK